MKHLRLSEPHAALASKRKLFGLPGAARFQAEHAAAQIGRESKKSWWLFDPPLRQRFAFFAFIHTGGKDG